MKPILLFAFLLLLACHPPRLTMEMADRVYRDSFPLPEGAITRCRPLSKTIVDLTITHPDGKADDKYLYFKKDKGRWHLYDIASITLINLIKRQRRELEEMTAEQIDSMTRPQYNFLLNSLRLKMAEDDTLVEHFNKYRPTFEHLKDSIQSEIPAHLLISNITTQDYYMEKAICFHILYDQVGYLYVKNKKDLPEMQPDKIMMLRQLGGGWYLYKMALYLN